MASQTFLLPKLLNRVGQIARIGRFLADLPAGKAWKIEVTEARSERSIQQNRYLNGVAYKLIGETTGYERDEISEVLCGRYFGEREKRVPKCRNFPSGIKMVPIRTTTTDESGKRCVLSKTEFADYVAFVQRFAAKHLGICIPDPDQDYEQHQEAA
ncbi:MAG TPA: hypothetical protein VHL05_15040 [Terriglobales bacterium]|nr:hypothetical protein [Terriglobales bacterium]